MGEKKMVHHPDEVWVWYGFARDKPWKKVKIQSQHRLQSDTKRTPNLLYFTQLKVAPAKLKDLQETAAFIPEPQRQFYLNMEAGKKADDNAEGDQSKDDQEDYTWDGDGD